MCVCQKEGTDLDHTKEHSKKPLEEKQFFTGKQLHSVPRGRPYQIRKLSKSKKRPNRPYGGNLCSECARQVFKQEARL